ncbi:MAG: hypothetical protein LBQ61_00570, partial [Spirochaetales bacterium]|nr:hypothetical protein [Spirochaetales bacterium]
EAASSGSFSYGGGVYIYNFSTQQPTIITGLTIEDATATGPSDVYGGGAYIYVRGALSLETVKITGTETASSGQYSRGGGLYINNASISQTTIVTCLTITDAKATATGGTYNLGGGAYIVFRTNISLDDVTIREVEAYWGGGLSLTSSTDTTLYANINNLTITDASTGSGKSGAIYASSSYPAYLYVNITNGEYDNCGSDYLFAGNVNTSFP